MRQIAPDENTKSELTRSKLVMVGIEKLHRKAKSVDENTKNEVDRAKVGDNWEQKTS